jgi:hypothetical protein
MRFHAKNAARVSIKLLAVSEHLLGAGRGDRPLWVGTHFFFFFGSLVKMKKPVKRTGFTLQKEVREGSTQEDVDASQNPHNRCGCCVLMGPPDYDVRHVNSSEKESSCCCQKTMYRR